LGSFRYTRNNSRRKEVDASQLPKCFRNASLKNRHPLVQNLHNIASYMPLASRSETLAPQLFRDVFNTSPLGIAVENLDGQPLFVNPALCSMLGFSEEELCKKHCVDFSPPEDATKDWELFQQLRAGAIDHYQLEKRYFRRDGSLVWGSLSISLLPSRPSPLVIAMVEDITRKKEAEEAQVRHSAIVESSEDAIASITLEGVIVSWNAGAQHIYGYTVAEAVGKSVKILVPPELAEEENKILERLRAGDRIKHYETVRLTKAGKRLNVSLSLSPIQDSSGAIVGFSGIARDISELKRREQELRTSEERLRLAQQAAHIGTFEWNIRTGVSTWTPELEAIYGLPPGGFGGTHKAFENLVHPDDLAGVIELFDRSFKSEQSANGEWRVLWPDGSVHSIAGRWQVFMGASGEPSRVIGVNMDVTERKRSEKRLREYEEAVEGAEDMIGVIDREYRFLLANRQYLKMRNMTREQVVGHFIPEMLNREIFESVVKPKLDECFQGKVVKYEMRFSYPTLGERDLSLSYFPIEGVNGIDRAACILRDITDRKRAEEALLEMNRALEGYTSLLRSREELLETFVKNVPAPVAMLDREMRYLQVSDRWCTDYLSGREQIIGRSHYEIFPDMPERWKEVHRRGLQGETLRADEDRWDGQDGPHWARWEVRPWKTAEGTVGGILILAEEITRRKQMEEMLSGMTRKLIQAQEQERARIARELHDDVNQRIALLAIELEQLGENPSRVQSRLQELKERVIKISTDIHAVAHDLHSSNLEYLGVAAGVKSWCREFAEREKMEIDCRFDNRSTLPNEIGLCLFRVLQQALHNAAKHSGVKRIEVQLREQSGEIHLIVRDSGRGFDVEAVKQGKGLGLTSMRERVRLANGTIAIESKPQAGTTIHVRIPLGSHKFSETGTRLAS
jgi:PAS domain S-box-containing protein